MGAGPGGIMRHGAWAIWQGVTAHARRDLPYVLIVAGALVAAAGATALAGGVSRSAAGEKVAVTPAGSPVSTDRDSLAPPTRIAVRVVLDTLHLALDLPARDFAAAGALRDNNADGWIDASELATSRDTLASYLEHRIIIIQDDGMLALELVGDVVPAPEAAAARVHAAMRAPLLNTYERIGFASGLLTDRIPGYRSVIAVAWKNARAEFDVAQSIQWVEPPAEGATELELPGRQPEPGAGH